MRDIENKEDVKLFVDAFYSSVQKDELLGEVFNNLEHFNWRTHIPVMYNFWESVLFEKGTYIGNPIKTHVDLHRKIPLTEKHFIRWKQLFFEAIDRLFVGPVANNTKAKAQMMEKLIQIKIKDSEEKGFIQ